MAMIVVLPRVLHYRWPRVTKHAVKIGVHHRKEVPSPLLTILIVLLYIPFRVRRL